jgi:hypothetical protein
MAKTTGKARAQAELRPTCAGASPLEKKMDPQRFLFVSIRG